VTVAIGEAKATAAAGADGKWMVKIGPLKAGGPLEMTVAGKNTLTIKNVLVGEVWVCSGQSNMQFGLSRSINAQAEMAGADQPEIRLYYVPTDTYAAPVDDPKSKWHVCSPKLAAGFSAVGYFFGRELHAKLKVPVGLIGCAYGGMPAQTFTPREAMKQGEFAPIIEAFDKSVEAFPQALAKYNADLPGIKAKYEQDVAKWAATTRPVDDPKKLAELMAQKPSPPQPPQDPRLISWSPGVLWDSMIHPLLPYGIAGVIWYQGESDAERANQYSALFPFMIQQWRKGFGQGDVPFLFVQIANHMRIAVDASEKSAWAELREAQTKALSLPKTAMAVTIDIGETGDIHPRNKQDVGHRLALGALKVAYDQDIVWASPMFDSMVVQEGTAVVKFKNVGAGLEVKQKDGNDARTQGIGDLKWFAVAGDDHKFVWAQAKVQGADTVLVRSDKVPNPVAVRYAWANNPMGCNLYSKDGLPASPFRTDDWPGVSGPWPPK
jgi:sialate O-acetylesterase